jgi:hypothetical protein
MTQNQSMFLRELQSLLDSYNIDSMITKDGRVSFISNGEDFSFLQYVDGSFYNIRTCSTVGEYKPERDDSVSVNSTD